MLTIPALIAIFGIPAGLLALTKRGRNVIRAGYNLALGNAEKTNIPAMIALAEEDLRTTEQKFNESLSEHAGQAELLMRQVQEQRERAAQLEKSVQFYLDKGDEANAGRYAAEYEKVNRELSLNEEQLTAAENAYRNLIQLRDDSVEASRKRLADLQARTKRAELMDRTNELQANAVKLSSSFAGQNDTLARLEKMAQDREANAIGKARVLGDSKVKTLGAIPEEVTQASALEKFKARNQPKQLGAPAPTITIQTTNTVEDSENYRNA